MVCYVVLWWGFVRCVKCTNGVRVQRNWISSSFSCCCQYCRKERHCSHWWPTAGHATDWHQPRPTFKQRRYSGVFLFGTLPCVVGNLTYPDVSKERSAFICKCFYVLENFFQNALTAPRCTPAVQNIHICSYLNDNEAADF